MPIKPGLFTSEFLVLVIGFIASFAVAKGWISQEDAAPITKAVQDIASSVIFIITSVAFIWSRVSIKNKAMEEQTKQQEICADGGTPNS